MNVNSIYNEDCIAGMRTIPDNFVDLVVTDPPYKLTSGGCNGGLGISFNQMTQEEMQSGKMFEVPPFDVWMREVYRVLKDGTHFYCMTNDKNMKDMLIAAEAVGFKEVNILVWQKYMHTPLPYYMKNVEFIILFRKGGARKIRHLGDTALIEGIRGVFGNKVHPSEKPTMLFSKLITNSCEPYDVVLDPFMGSGTTAVACIREKRNYIGYEVDAKYYNIACQRVDWEQRQLTLF